VVTPDLARALLRGRFMRAAAQIEHTGVPVDTVTLARLQRHWDDIQGRLIRTIDAHYGVYEGSSFKVAQFERWLARQNIPWPRLPSDELDLKDETFKAMVRSYPVLAPLRELRRTLAQLRLTDLAVGSDGRNRCIMSAFRARTGRNQPSNSRFIFGPSVWLRSLIRPEPGQGLAYIDWCQQEFGIAAALSGDPLMQAAYRSGDPYLEFAKQAGAVPADATKETHKAEREQFKACVLAVQYGMGAAALAQRINQPEARARELLRLHRETYRVFWAWSDGAVDHAMLHGQLWTVFGWTVHTGTDPNPRFLRNFLMQANGAEMLRLACCLLVETGINVCAPVHDAVLIEAPLDQLDAVVAQAQAILAQASAIVLDGFLLRSETELVRHPDRYRDPRGVVMWDTVISILTALEAEDGAPAASGSSLAVGGRAYERRPHAHAAHTHGCGRAAPAPAGREVPEGANSPRLAQSRCLPAGQVAARRRRPLVPGRSARPPDGAAVESGGGYVRCRPLREGTGADVVGARRG
jgi:DNA polymerase-1